MSDGMSVYKPKDELYIVCLFNVDGCHPFVFQQVECHFLESENLSDLILRNVKKRSSEVTKIRDF